MPNDRKDIIARVLLFLYTGDYDDIDVPTFGIDQPTAPPPSLPLMDATVEENNDGGPKASQSITSEAEKPVSKDAQSADKLSVRESKRREQQISAMDVNARVYVCADKFGLGKLKQRATEKFMSVLQKVQELASMQLAYGSFRFVYENTAQADAHLRRAITRHCIIHHSSITKEVFDLVKEHEATTWALGLELRGTICKEKRKHIATLAKSHAELVSIKQQLKHNQEELKGVVGLVNGDMCSKGSRCLKADMTLKRLGCAGNTLLQYQLSCKCCGNVHFGVRSVA